MNIGTISILFGMFVLSAYWMPTFGGIQIGVRESVIQAFKYKAFSCLDKQFGSFRCSPGGNDEWEIKSFYFETRNFHRDSIKIEMQPASSAFRLSIRGVDFYAKVTCNILTSRDLTLLL